MVAPLRIWSELRPQERQAHLATVRGFLRAIGPAAAKLQSPKAAETSAGGKARARGRARGSAGARSSVATATQTGTDHRDLPGISQPVESLKGVGPATGERLRNKGLHAVRDMLLLLPRRYEDLRPAFDFSEEPVGDGDEQYGHGLGTVVSARVSWLRRRGARRLVAPVRFDGGGEAEIQLFQFGEAQSRAFQAGARIAVSGRAEGRRRRWQLIHPRYLFPESDDAPEVAALATLRPRYPEIAGVPARTLEKVVRGAAQRYASELPDPLPMELRERLGLPALGEAIAAIHAPPEDLGTNAVAAVAEGRHPAARRLALQELLGLQLALLRSRGEVQRTPGLKLEADREQLLSDLEARFAISLTGAQRRCLTAIVEDMAAPVPMTRLLQGDVGSGKTLVAFGAALAAMRAGYQVAMMVPTEILAEQHCARLEAVTRALGFRTGLVVGGSGKAVRDATAAGELDLLIGTHALESKRTGFARLGLVIIDEQHRFGVGQRARLVAKGAGGRPDLLVMTATPIPRSLAMAVYGDLELSVIDELPPGRRPVPTELVEASDRDRAYQVVADELAAAGRVYVVCPLVEQSETLDLRAAETTWDELRARFGDRVGLLHGRMGGAERAEALVGFASGRYPILVATTVVEVGIDIREATLIVVESAQRFGLSQLHQLRGRVGRPGSPRARCLLVAPRQRPGTPARHRLAAMAETGDGFRLAEMDLALRGPGQLLGTQQAGLGDLAFANLARHGDLLEAARRLATTLLQADPDLADADHAELRALAEHGASLLGAG